jgi:hypothetical protein
LREGFVHVGHGGKCGHIGSHADILAYSRIPRKRRAPGIRQILRRPIMPESDNPLAAESDKLHW